MSDQRGKRKPYQKGLRADYQGATPEQVARAMMRSSPSTEQVVVPQEVHTTTLRDFVRRIRRSFGWRERSA